MATEERMGSGGTQPRDFEMFAFIIGAALTAAQPPCSDVADAHAHQAKYQKGKGIVSYPSSRDDDIRRKSRVSDLAPRIVAGVPRGAEAQKDADDADRAEEQRGVVAEKRQLVRGARDGIASSAGKARAPVGNLGSIMVGGAYIFACIGWILLLIGRTRTVRAHGILLLTIGIWGFNRIIYII